MTTVTVQVTVNRPAATVTFSRQVAQVTAIPSRNRFDGHGTFPPGSVQGTLNLLIDRVEEGGTTISAPTAVPLGGHRVIALPLDGPTYADCRDLSTADAALGISKDATAAGDDVVIVRLGEITEPSWHWDDGPVLLGHDGTLTQTLPADAAFLLVIGMPTAPDTLFVAPREPITLKEF